MTCTARNDSWCFRWSMHFKLWVSTDTEVYPHYQILYSLETIHCSLSALWAALNFWAISRGVWPCTFFIITSAPCWERGLLLLVITQYTALSIQIQTAATIPQLRAIRSPTSRTSQSRVVTSSLPCSTASCRAVPSDVSLLTFIPCFSRSLQKGGVRYVTC